MKASIFAALAIAATAVSAQAANFELIKIQVDGANTDAQAVVRCHVKSDSIVRSTEIYGSTIAQTSPATVDNLAGLEAIIYGAVGNARPDLGTTSEYKNYWLKDLATGETKLLASNLKYQNGTSYDVNAASPDSHKLVRLLNRVCPDWR